MLYPRPQHTKYLNNIIAQSSQQQQDQSSCSQCKRNTYGIQQQEQQQDESEMKVIGKRKNDTESSSQNQAEVPYRKRITELNYQFEEMLTKLQYQVDSLKRQNQTKDIMINELKFQVQKSAVEEQRKLQSNKQAYEINRLRQQLGCSPRNNNNFLPSNYNFRSASLQYAPMAQHQVESSAFRGEIYNPSTASHMKQKLSSKPFYIEPPKQTINSTDYQLQITILQKQIRQYQLELLQQKQRLTLLQEENKWQVKFIHSFVKMCDQLSLNYGERLKLNKIGQDMKKKTKICWNYMKNLIGYFIQQSHGRCDEMGQNC